MSGKVVMIPELPVVHIAHGEYGSGWNGAGAGWRQFGTLGINGVYLLDPANRLPRPCRVRLTDTLDARQHELVLGPNDVSLPEDVVTVKGGNIVFLGKDIGHHHIHLAYLQE